jgi:plastocyanin
VTRRLLACLLALLAALASVVLVAAPASAAVTKVSLTSSGPSPATVTIRAGDTVAFTNTDTVSHTLKSTSSNWTLKATTVAAKTTKSLLFSKPGTFDYSDSYQILVGIPQTSAGHVVVPKSASASPTPRATASRTPAPTSAPTRPPVATPTPSATVTPGAGVAVPPPINGGVIPSPGASPSLGPAPQVAPPGTSPVPVTPAPVVDVAYGDHRAIVQGSAHRFGLPAVLALVAAVGVLTLLGRVLLRAPEARRRVR